MIWSADCTVPHLHWFESVSPILNMFEPKRPTPVRRRLSLDPCFSWKKIARRSGSYVFYKLIEGVGRCGCIW